MRPSHLAMSLIGAMFALAAAAQAEPAQVKVETGLLAGEDHDGVAVYRNIPFAAPPVDALRWAPPAKAPAWSGVRDAVKVGPSCVQPMTSDGSPNSGGANGPMSEDCLQLNVYTPTGAKGAPVMVWIHGGSHRTGAGWVYDGTNFAKDGVILVTINYRLGPLGYFAHPALTKAAKPGEPLGNYGLMDQIAALKWVQRNIKAFGGDPKRVTVFGESAGGMSTLALLATPSTKGLYKQAMVQSGGGWFAPTRLTVKEADGLKALKAMGVEGADATQLRALSAADLVAKIGGSFGPFVDGKLMTETPSQAFAAGRAADVPLVIGSNSGEDSLMGPWSPSMAAMIPPAARSIYIQEAAAGDEVLARAIFTDRIMGAPARWVARTAAGGQPTWLYHFSYVGSRFRPVVTRAFHAAEIQYVFHYWGRRTPLSMVSEQDQAMASLMHSCWVAFAKTGRPDCPTGPAWPAYNAASDQLMEFGDQSGIIAHFRQLQMDAQDTTNLPSLKLAN